MSNIEMLEKLTVGKDAIETVELKNGAKIELRPLTSGQLSELQTIEKKGFVMKVGVNPQGKRQSAQSNTDVDVNAGDFNKYQAEAMYKAIAWSMEIDEEAVKKFEVGIPEEIFEHIIRISHLSDNDLTLIKTFRKD